MKLASVASTGVALLACRAAMTDTPTPQPAATVTPPPATPTTAIVQPAVASPETFIQYAFEVRQRASEWGDLAYSAIVVRDDLVVGPGPSRVVINHDATTHAEMEAIRDASRRLGTADLSGCILYSTSRPCGLCEMAAYWANGSRMIYGLNATDAGAPQFCSR